MRLIAVPPMANRHSASRSREAQLPMCRASATGKSMWSTSRSPAAPKLVARIPVAGNPNNILLNRAQTRLFVAADNSDRVSVIDTATNRVSRRFAPPRPPACCAARQHLPGAAPNSLTLSPDEKTLYVTNGGMNAIAVISLAPGQPHRVVGLIPTGWYPQSISISRDGKTLYDVNSKSDPGPNPLYDGARLRFRKRIPQCTRRPINTFCSSRKRAAGHSGTESKGTRLADQEGRRQRFPRHGAEPAGRADDGGAAPAHQACHLHRQREPDVRSGARRSRSRQWRSRLAEFGKIITPNQHRLAEQFVDLDNILCSGEVSGNGWPWSTAARETDFNVKTVPLSYAGGRGIGLPVAERQITPLARLDPTAG